MLAFWRVLSGSVGPLPRVSVVQQLMFVEAGKAEWVDAPTPTLEGPMAALVRPTAVTTCALDIAVMLGLAGSKKPFALGHEFMGTVIDVGEGVTSLSVGDRVITAFEISCGTCGRCRSGLTANCESVPKNSMFGLGPWSGADYGGALADVVRIPFADAMCVAVPADTPPAAASLGDNTTDGWRAVGPFIDPLDPVPVLVVGNGAIGIAAVAVACALGSHTTYLATDPADKAVAETFGAEVLDVSSIPKKAKQKYGITVSSGGDPAALNCAVRSTDHGGVCTDTGIFFEPSTPMPLLAMYDAGITFRTGRAHIRTDLPAVLELVTDNRLDVTKLVQSESEWDSADIAFSEVKNKLLITRR